GYAVTIAQTAIASTVQSFAFRLNAPATGRSTGTGCILSRLGRDSGNNEPLQGEPWTTSCVPCRVRQGSDPSRPDISVGEARFTSRDNQRRVATNTPADVLSGTSALQPAPN